MCNGLQSVCTHMCGMLFVHALHWHSPTNDVWLLQHEYRAEYMHAEVG